MNVKETRGEVLDQLNKLLTRSHDAEKGYQEAAENVKDTELKSLFLAQSRQRGEFAMEVEREVRTLGGEPDNGTSLAADLHRAWINVKSTFASNDDKATVQECQRGDQDALENYTSVLQETDLVASTRELLLRQKQSIESGPCLNGSTGLGSVVNGGIGKPAPIGGGLFCFYSIRPINEIS